MIKISKEQQPLYLELKQIEKEMRQAAEQSQVYRNSMIIIQRSVKKNQLTIKQLEKVGEDRTLYVPLGRAFLKRGKEETMKQFHEANQKLLQSTTGIQKDYKFYTEKANQKQALLKEGSERLVKMGEQK